jgi:CDP-6-deoxy-D-xylo-4-hexulose-3-dehydrase
MSPHIRFPYAQAKYGPEEIDAVAAVMKNGTQMSARAAEFERRIAALFEKKRGILVNSGTSALYLGVESLGLPAGGEVITPALTFSSTVACLVKNGLIPAFVDAAPQTFCIDEAKMEEMITPKTAAILAPNLVGNLCEWEFIGALAKKRGLVVIEDCADTLGATFRGKSSGHWADMSITSFYGSHIINGAGNGGMLCLNDDAAIKKALLLRSWGRDSSLFDPAASEKVENRFNVELDGVPYDAKFVFSEIGYQLEGSEIAAACGLEQLKKLPDFTRHRQWAFERLLAIFGEHEEFFELPKQTPETETSWLGFPVVVRAAAPFLRRSLQVFLEERNIQTRVVLAGNILRQPGFANIACKKAAGGYPVADDVMRGGVMFGCHNFVTEEMLNHLRDSVAEFLRQQKAI